MPNYHFHLYIVTDNCNVELETDDRIAGVIPAGATANQAVLVTYNITDPAPPEE